MSVDKNKKTSSTRSPFGFRGHGGMRPAEKAKDIKGTIKRLLKYLKPTRGKVILAILMALGSSIFGIISPKIMGLATTKLFEGALDIKNKVVGATIDFGYILNIVLILLVLYLLSAIFNYFMHYLMADVAQKTVFRLRKDVSDKLSKLPLKYYDQKTHGEILSRVTNDIENISTTLQQGITQLIISSIYIVGVVIIMLVISPIMTLITLATLPLSILFTKYIAKKSQKYFKGQQKILGELNGHVEEAYTGHKIIKAFSQEEKVLKKFEHMNDQLYNVGWKAQFVSGVIMPVIMFINNLGYVAIAVAGSIFASRGAFAIGDIQAFIQYSREFGHPIVQMANIANSIQSTIASAERVFEILDEEEEVKETNNPIIIKEAKGNIAFNHVDFSYIAEQELLKDMNIEVATGQKVAIIGPTGAGKTTLVNLLMRFYELDGGHISVDGINISDMTRNDLRSMFGMVLQDTWLFKGTIKDNILYGKPTATEEEVIFAAQSAHADHFIKSLPEGYDTILEEDANNISQGQRQLITIARAFLANPQFLILDEATSSVDTRTEKIIQKAMEKLMKGRTSFVIAHRLSTIIDADIILVMNEGKIIEKGTHEELLAMNGFYHELYSSQFVAS